MKMRNPTLYAAGLVLVGSLGVQFSSALSSTLFAAVGPFEVSGSRMTIAAIVMLAIFRPTVRKRSHSDWVGIVIYGVAMAAMNACLYLAISRIPLGVAVTLEFLGPCAVALIASHRIREGLCAVLALVGVTLISAGPLGYFSLSGYAAALGAAVAFGLYTVCAERVGKASSGLDSLSLSVTVAAILTLPFSLSAVGQINLGDLGILVISALVGVVVPYSVDTISGRITSARVVGTLFAIDPAMGVLVAFFFLGQAMSPAAIIGVLIVAGAGALLVWASGRQAKNPTDGTPN